MFDLKSLFDSIDAAFGRAPRRKGDYTLREGDVVRVDDVTYTVRALDFIDPACATATELAVCLQCEGADVRVVDDGNGFRRVEPRPRITRAEVEATVVQVTDPRVQMLLSLLPPGAVFRHCYGDDSLWCPNSRGYVNERDPLRAGLYQPDGYYESWKPPARVECSDCFGIPAECDDGNVDERRCETCSGEGYVDNPDGRRNDHSFTIDAAEMLRKYTIQDGTPLALLIDEVLRLRARVDLVKAALIERGHTDECYSGMIEECDCPLKILGDTAPVAVQE